MKDFQPIRQRLSDNVAQKMVSGCCAAVFLADGCIFSDYAGTANGVQAAGAHTAFRLASMTKPITAAAVLLCVQDGLLSLHDAVSKYLPPYRELYVARETEHGFARGERAREVTVFHLLTHTSGIGSGAAGDAQYGSLKPCEGDTLASAVTRYAEGLLAFQPGSAQFYSPVLGFDVAARIVEIVSGMPYAEFLRKRIFQPLGMSETSYDLARYARENLALTYKSENGALTSEALLHNFDTFPAGYTGGGAGLLSTIGDYGAFAAELLNALHGRGKVLARESVLNMATPWLDGRYEGICPVFNWGLGVRVVSEQNEAQPLSAGSFGWSGAYGTHFWVDPERAFAAVYLHNSATYGGAGAPHTVEFERAVMRCMT